jgi:integrase
MYLYKREDESSKFWWYSFSHRGKRYKGSTKKTKKNEAAEWAAQKRRQLINEEVGLVDFTAPPTFRAFSTEFLETAKVRYHGRQRTLEFYQSKLKNLLAFPVLSNARLDQINEAMIDRYKLSRKDVVSVATCNRELATLSIMLRLAHERLYIRRLPRIRKYREPEPRDYTLKRDDEQTLLEACDQPLADLITLLVDTGLRVGEALSLTREDVHTSTTASYIKVRRGKSRNAERKIPLTPRVKRLLRARIASAPASGWLFPGRSGDEPLQVTSADHMFRKTCDAIVDDDDKPVFPKEFVLHSLRHTCLSRLAEQGVGPFEIMRIAGHGSILMTQRYVHTAGDAIERAMVLLDKSNSKPEPGEKATRVPHSLPQSWEWAA